MIYPKALEQGFLKKINRLIKYSRVHSPYYKKLFKKIHLPEEIRALSDFESIPITSRDDLINRNDEFIAVARDMWSDVVSTSGTTGKPICIPFTKKDILKNAYFIAKKFSIFGLKKEDIVYITVPIDQSMWIGGLSVWLGCFEIGACSIRAGNISMDKHIEFIKRLRPTIIFGLPSFILKLGEEIKIRRLNNIPKPRLIVTFGENIMHRDFSRNSLGKSIENLWGSKLISGYCSTEASPGFECIFQSGHHILSEMLYVEIVEPKTMKVLGPLQDGLLVVTHFGREGLPLIRYAPGDVSFLDNSRCECGRATPRLGSVLGRIDEMAKIKGVNFYPSQLEEVLLGIPFVGDFIIELFTDRNLCDRIKILIRFKPETQRKIDKLGLLQNKIRDTLGIKIPLEEMAKNTREERLRLKQSRIIDRRIKNRG